MRSINVGLSTSYGCNPSFLNLSLMASISDGLNPCSMILLTNAANCGSCQPFWGLSSVCTKSKPLNGWSTTIRPKRWTPHSLQALRWMAADSSMMWSLSPLAVTETASLGITPTTEKRAPLGFQHFEQPQAWLCATLLASVTSTFLVGQWQ